MPSYPYKYGRSREVPVRIHVVLRRRAGGRLSSRTYWKYGFTLCGSGVLSSATIIDEI
jgi:hypothetical protein